MSVTTIHFFFAFNFVGLLSSSSAQLLPFLPRFVNIAASTNGTKCGLTAPATKGPYYLPNAPFSNGTLCSNTKQSHQRLLLRGQIMDATDCATPIPAQLEIWQANMNGHYSFFQYNNRFDCRATMQTDNQGRFFVETKFPGRYLTNPAVPFSYRPAHIHFRITARNETYGILTTQLYFEHDAYLYPRDSCMSAECASNDPSLILPVTNDHDVKTFEGTWNVYIRPGGNGDVDKRTKTHSFIPTPFRP